MGAVVSPHNENFYDNIIGGIPKKKLLFLLHPVETCSKPSNMDDFPWQEVKSGDLERLQVLLSSSSTARRGRALQDLRDRAGKMESSRRCEAANGNADGGCWAV